MNKWLREGGLDMMYACHLIFNRFLQALPFGLPSCPHELETFIPGTNTRSRLHHLDMGSFPVRRK